MPGRDVACDIPICSRLLLVPGSLNSSLTVLPAPCRRRDRSYAMPHLRPVAPEYWIKMKSGEALRQVNWWGQWSLVVNGQKRGNGAGSASAGGLLGARKELCLGALR